MANFRGIRLSFIVFIIIGTVKGRRLELETSPTLVISDGIHDMPYDDPQNLYMEVSNSSVSMKTLYTEKRCQSIYGFLPCADTMQEGVFLMVMYTYLMMLGEEWIHKGSQALFVLLGDKAVGSSVFQVLMALPRIVIVIVSGVLSTASDAQKQVAFGVSMYAGSTVISLTLIWGFHVILSRDNLHGKGSTLEHEHPQDPSLKFLPLKYRLSILTDTGVNIEKKTGDIAVIMLLSLIPFAVVQLIPMINSPVMILISIILSGASLLLYFAYQIMSPWIRVRSLAYLKQENLRTRFLYHVQQLAQDDLIDEHGKPKVEVFKSIFKQADEEPDESISIDELEKLITEKFRLQDDKISIEYAKVEILTHFDRNKNGAIDWPEFQKGCTKWLEQWKNVANNSDVALLKNPWKQVKKLAINNKRAEITKIEKLMPRILKQVLEEHKLVTKVGEPDREKIEGLFSQYDKDGDNKIHKKELKEFIKTLHFGVSLDHDKVLDEVLNHFDKDCDGSIQKEEFVDGLVKWIQNAINHDPSIKDPKHAIAKFEQYSWEEVDTLMKKEKPKVSVIYVIYGIGVIYLISGAFIQSVIQFSNAAHIPFLFTSFVMAPIAMNAKMVIMAALDAGSHVSKNASLAFSEIYSRLVMNNLLGLTTLLVIVCIKGLSWGYSNEVLMIMVHCAIVGLFALKRSTYPLWASISAMLLYPISIYLYYVFTSG